MPKNKLFPALILGLSVLGFADAAFLTARHFLGGAIPCVLFTGCETVTTSAYATWGPVPVALVGAFFYLSVLILSVLFFDLKRPIFLRLILWLSGVAFLASLYFVYLQAFVLKTFCSYCLLSAICSTLIFLLSLGLRLRAPRPESLPNG